MKKQADKIVQHCDTHIVTTAHSLRHQRCSGRQLFGIWTVRRRLEGGVKH